MAQGKSIPIGQSDSRQGVLLRVIENPQGKKPGIKLSPLQRAHSEMVRELSLLAPAIPLPSADPSPEEIRSFAPYLTTIAQCFDRHIRACGVELSAHVLGVDLSQFTDVAMSGSGIEGNALYEIEAAALGVAEGTDIRTSMWAVE
jgi:hypothetical protein